MDRTAVLPSRVQLAGTVSFHTIFPAFTVGLAAGLCVAEARWLTTGSPVYRRLFDCWLTIFAIACGMRVVPGIAMALRLGEGDAGASYGSADCST